jgi:1,4-dihydroxy-2-naphthoate octaprenyltransferase
LWFWLGFGFSAWILLPMLTLPQAWTMARAAMTLDRYEDLVPITPKAGRLLLAYAVLLAIGASVPPI